MFTTSCENVMYMCRFKSFCLLTIGKTSMCAVDKLNSLEFTWIYYYPTYMRNNANGLKNYYAKNDYSNYSMGHSHTWKRSLLHFQMKFVRSCKP